MNSPDQAPTSAPRRALEDSDAPPQEETVSLLRRLEFQQVLSAVSTCFINLPAEEIDSHINRVLGRVASFLGFNLAAISKFSGLGNVGEVTHIWTAEELPPIPPGFTELDFPWVATRLTQGCPVHLPCLGDLPPAGQRDRQTYGRLAVHSAYNWPLHVGRAVVGCLCLASVGDTRSFPVQFEEELRLLAQIMASTLSRMRADQALRESEARLSLAADAAEVGLWSLNLATRCFWLTKKTRELFHFPADEAMTFERFLSLVHPDDQELIRQTLQTLVQSKSEGHVEYRIVRPDASVRWMFSRGRVRCDNPGEPDYLMGVSMDITARKQAEAETQEMRDSLVHLTRVNKLGVLSGSLAHELNQPLGIILSNAQAAQELLAQEPPDVSEVQAILTDIVAADRHASEVIERLRTLLKRGQVVLQPLPLNQVIDEVLHLARAYFIGRGVTVVCELVPDLPPIAGDRVQLQQLVLNLILNAAEAMAANAPGTRRLHLQTMFHQGRVRASVRDEGCGLPDDPERLFQPFHTTKPQGLGLGLAICRSIVAAHHGRLWAEPYPERGAAFHFELPVAASPD